MRGVFPIGTLVWHSTVGLGIVKEYKRKMNPVVYLVHYFSTGGDYDQNAPTVKNMVEAYKMLTAVEK